MAQVVTLADQLAAAREELAKERGEVDDFLAAQDYRKYCAWVEDAQADVVSGRGERPGSLPMYLSDTTLFPSLPAYRTYGRGAHC